MCINNIIMQLIKLVERSVISTKNIILKMIKVLKIIPSYEY